MPPPPENLSAGITRLDQPSALRSLLSVALAVHLCCVAIVLASNHRRSALLDRLVSIFAVYTRALNFDPNFTPFHLTGDGLSDSDHLLEVEPLDGPAAEEVFSLPFDRSGWLEERRRFMAITNLMGSQAFFLTDERSDANDDTAAQLTAELAKGIGAHFLKKHGGTRCVVTSIRRTSQPRDLRALASGLSADDPTAEAYDKVIYTADVILGADGEALATRRQSTRDVAPVKSTLDNNTPAKTAPEATTP